MKKLKDESWRMEFPEVTDVEKAWGGYPDEFFAKAMESYKEGSNNWDRLASQIFFRGGTVPVNKKLDPA